MDAILFYVFWEMSLVPMYFIVGVWGGARRIYATLSEVLYLYNGRLSFNVVSDYFYDETYARSHGRSDQRIFRFLYQ